VVSLAIILERMWVLSSASRRSARLREAAEHAWRQGGMSELLALARMDDSPLGVVYRAVLTVPGGDEDTRLRVANRRIAEGQRSMRRFVWLIGTIGSLAPFIGLLGTVLGIVRSFESMAAAESGGFAVVAAGISEALIATAGGLLVGVLAIFAYNALTVRIGNAVAQLREWTDDLLVALRVGERAPVTHDVAAFR
jgi:biopolymer transport protein ExbB/TolQ